MASFFVARSYKDAIEIIISKIDHPSDTSAGYPIQLLLSTAFELYLKTQISIDFLLKIENISSVNNEQIKKELDDILSKKYSHHLDKMFNDYSDIKEFLGIKHIKRENDSAKVWHYEIFTTDQKFPKVHLKNSESARYANFSKKPDCGYANIVEKISEQEGFVKIAQGEKILIGIDKLFDLLTKLDLYVKKEFLNASQKIPYEIDCQSINVSADKTR